MEDPWNFAFFFFGHRVFHRRLAASAYPYQTGAGDRSLPTGGSNDIVGRMVAAKLSERLGQQVYVENIAGPADPSDRTRPQNRRRTAIPSWSFPPPITIYTSLYNLPYDPEKDFVPVSLMGSGPNVLTVNPSLPAKSLKELLALAKAKPGELVCGAAGVGSFQHMGTELFKYKAGIDFMIVQFKGGGPSITDLLGGHSNFALPSLAMVTSHIRSGKLRPLGTGGAKRSSLLPDVPTIAEAGVPGYESTNWWGLLAPTGTPKVIVERLNKELKTILELDETKKMFFQQGADADWMSQPEFEAYISRKRKWAQVVKRPRSKSKGESNCVGRIGLEILTLTFAMDRVTGTGTTPFLLRLKV
jgi:tripartite-type tricarboxylate transporter receptor subunit TctC